MNKRYWLFIIVLLLTSCGGLPGDVGSDEIQLEPWEEKAYDQYLDDKYSKYAEEAASDSYEDRIDEIASEAGWDNNSDIGNQSSSKCPYGCKQNKPGCVIKGNISFDSEEKIYHLPGQEFYDETIIRPEYGERWFCAEE